MARVYQGSFLTGTGIAGSTFDITAPGFAAAAIIFAMNPETTTDADFATQGDGISSHGFYANGKNRAQAVTSAASAGADGDSRHVNSACVLLINGAGAEVSSLKVATILPNGFRMEVVTAFASNRPVMYTAIAAAAADISDVTFPVATGNDDQQPFSFDPNFLYLLGGPAGLNAAGGFSSQHIGAVSTNMVDPAGYVLSSSHFKNAGNSQATRYCRGGDMMAAKRNSSTSVDLDARASFVQFLTGGWRWNVITSAFQPVVSVLGMRFSTSPRLFEGLTQTDIVTPISVSGFGFTPEAGMVLSANAAESAAGSHNDNASMSIGMFSSPSQRRSTLWGADNNFAGMRTSTAWSVDEVYIFRENGGVLRGEMDLQSVDADGFTFIMDDADPSAKFFWGIGWLGNAAGGGAHWWH